MNQVYSSITFEIELQLLIQHMPDIKTIPLKSNIALNLKTIFFEYKDNPKVYKHVVLGGTFEYFMVTKVIFISVI
jgi:hypothetical protein